jgi:hypothetical protein
MEHLAPQAGGRASDRGSDELDSSTRGSQHRVVALRGDDDAAGQPEEEGDSLEGLVTVPELRPITPGERALRQLHLMGA